MDKLEGMEGADVVADNVIHNPDEDAYDTREEIETTLPEEADDEAEAIEDEPITEGEEPEGTGEVKVDYAKIMREDIAELRSRFPELDGLESITELNNPMRYAALRDLGLTATEAYLATSERRMKDNRSHLSSAVPGGIGAPRSNMTRSELERARELFPGLGDGELIGLYKKVNL